MSVSEWVGCSANKCPYDNEHGDCEYCMFLIKKDNNSQKPKENEKRT